MSRVKKENKDTPDIVIKKRIQTIRETRYVVKVLIKVIVFLICVYITFFKIFGVTTMSNSDMMPRISAGDLILYYRLDESYSSPDIVVFDLDDKEYIGRIIATPGESIGITDGYIIEINGNKIIEDDIFYKTYKYGDNVEYPLELGEDEYFIMCDSREGAKDSRYFGAINKSNIKGYIVTVLRRNNL